MGRKSRAKRERREHGGDRVAAIAKGRPQAELLALVEAAAASPTASHCIPSLAHVLDSVLKRRSHGSRAVTPDLVPALVDAAHAEQPDLSLLEDFVPYDVREAVAVRWGSELFRLLPGALERPVAIVDHLELLTQTIDDVLIPEIGYGLDDVVELVLRRVDHVVSVLSPSWPTEDRAELGEQPRILPNELDAARSLRPLREQVRACRHPDRVELALAAYSTSAKRLSYSPREAASSFSDTIAIRQGAEAYLPLPAAFLMESLDAVAISLASRAVTIDNRVRRLWREVVAVRLAELLKGSGHQIYGPLRTERGSGIHSIIAYGPRQFLAIDLVAELTIESLESGLARSRRSLDGITSGSSLRGPAGLLTIPSNAEIETVQVFATSGSGTRIIPARQPPLSLLDFLRIARSSVREREDMWYYAKDRASGYEEGLFAVGEMDLWEYWRQNGKTFRRLGRPMSGMFVMWSGAEEEWKDESQRYELEQALLALQLPPSRAWPIIDFAEDEVDLCDLLNMEYLQVLPWETPIVISPEHPRDRDVDTDLIHNLTQAMIFLLRIIRREFVDVCRASGISAVRIDFRHDPRPDAPPLNFGNYEAPIMTVYWGASLQDAYIEESGALQSVIAQILTQIFPASPQREVLLAAWDAAPPALRIDQISIGQHQKRLDGPHRVHSWHRSTWTRRLLTYLFESGVEAKNYGGEDAKRLDTDTIYPWLLSSLHQQFGVYDRISVLEFALSQLERLYCKRRWIDEDLAHVTGFPTFNDAAVERLRAQRADLFLLSRAIALLIEELLRWPNAGEQPVDELAWLDLLSVADLCVESCSRSELLHKELAGHRITISEAYEIQMHTDVEIRIDLDAYRSALSEETEPTPMPIKLSRSGSDDVSAEQPRSIVSVQPYLVPIDHSLRQNHGFGLDAVIGCLDAATHWIVPADKPFAASSADDIASIAVQDHGVVAFEEYRRAVEWLALLLDGDRSVTGHAVSVKHWETERRAERLITRCFIRSDSCVYVLPWTAAAGLKVLCNYLEDARLPWPESMIGNEVAATLASVRQDRNLELERECEQQLIHPDIVVRRNIKPHKAKRIGLADLSGEIDLLVVDSSWNYIWVVEVKDPYFPYSPRSVDRQIRQFHSAGEYVDKLRTKVGEISKSSSAVAKALGALPPDRRWDVRGMFTTRRVTPAAFVSCEDIVFCTIGDVRDIVLGARGSDTESTPR